MTFEDAIRKLVADPSHIFEDGSRYAIVGYDQFLAIMKGLPDRDGVYYSSDGCDPNLWRNMIFSAEKWTLFQEIANG